MPWWHFCAHTSIYVTNIRLIICVIWGRLLNIVWIKETAIHGILVPFCPGSATSMQMLLEWRRLSYIRSSPAPTEANKCHKPRSHNRRVLPWEHVVITSTQISYQNSSLLRAQKRSHTLTWFCRSSKTWGKWEMRLRDSDSRQASVTMTAEKGARCMLGSGVLWTVGRFQQRWSHDVVNVIKWLQTSQQ